MDTFGVAIMPIADMQQWRQFLDEISNGSRGEAHRDFLRRAGVSGEYAFHQSTPMGDLMVLVWDGVDSAGMVAALGEAASSPQNDHERYLRDHVIPRIHGVDPSQGPPPAAELASSIRL